MFRERLRALSHLAARHVRLARSMRRASPPPGRWISVLGTEDSGAQWVHDTLAADATVGRFAGRSDDHTDQLLRPETMNEVGTWGIEPVHYALDELDEHAVDTDRWLRQWTGAVTPGGAEVAVEHSPANAVRARFLDRQLPGLRVIRVIRDAPDVAGAMRGRLGVPLADLAAHWRRINEILDNDVATLTAVLTIRFESIIDDPIGTAAELRAFAGTGPGAIPPVPPVAPPLTQDERAIVDAIAGGIRDRLGYV